MAHPIQYPVKVGDIGGEYDDEICTGYHVTDRPGPGFPYSTHACWWNDSEQYWEMFNPTGRGSIRVADELEILPTFETQYAISAQIANAQP
ncbi:MAG: hypothetical protein ACRC62_36685 [Microcoleus sp.]